MFSLYVSLHLFQFEVVYQSLSSSRYLRDCFPILITRFFWVILQMLVGCYEAVTSLPYPFPASPPPAPPHSSLPPSCSLHTPPSGRRGRGWKIIWRMKCTLRSVFISEELWRAKFYFKFAYLSLALLLFFHILLLVLKHVMYNIFNLCYFFQNTYMARKKYNYKFLCSFCEWSVVAAVWYAPAYYFSRAVDGARNNFTPVSFLPAGKGRWMAQ